MHIDRKAWHFRHCWRHLSLVERVEAGTELLALQKLCVFHAALHNVAHDLPAFNLVAIDTTGQHSNADFFSLQ